MSNDEKALPEGLTTEALNNSLVSETRVGFMTLLKKEVVKSSTGEVVLSEIHAVCGNGHDDIEDAMECHEETIDRLRVTARHNQGITVDAASGTHVVITCRLCRMETTQTVLEEEQAWPIKKIPRPA